MPKAIEMKIGSFKEILRKTHFKNNDIAISVLEKLEKLEKEEKELKTIYPINLGTDEHKKFIGYTDNCLIVAYSKGKEVEKIDNDTKEKYTEEDRIIVIDKIPKNSIKKVELIESDSYGENLELYIDLDVECDKEKTIYLNNIKDSRKIHSKYELDEYTLMDTIELFAKELI